MRIKFAVLILILGFVLEFIGSFLKITHQAMADEILAVATILKVIGLLLFTLMLLAHPKIKEFLEYDKFKDSFK